MSKIDFMKLKKYKLGDIAKIEISGVDKKTIEGETPVRLCNFVDVYYNWAITKEKAKSFMVASAKQTEIDKCSIGKGMVAITKDSETRDDIGVATYIADDFEYVLLGYHCALITPNPAVVDGKYLNAFMHTRYIQKYFENNASGSGQRYTLSNDTISNIPVLLPSIEEQHIIGKLLADLDRKIELNKQINDNLEAMAKQLYDYWFVQFDFPNEEGKPYKSSGGAMVWNEKLKREIPQEWSDCKLKDFINLFDSKRVPLSSKDRGERQGVYPYYGATGIMDYVNDYIFDGDYILLAEDGSTSDAKGFPIVQYIWGKNWVNNHAHIILPKNERYTMFTYQMLRSIPAKQIETGSIQKKISQENLCGYKMVLPNSDLLEKYENVVSPLWEKRKRCIEEINTLTKQRDELLPLLMNGQASVNYHLSDD
jgi:hypothetical protein